MSVLVWIVGRGGLLGSSTERALQARRGVRVWRPALPAFRWDDQGQLPAQLDQAARLFFESLSLADRGWWILWCAGTGVVGSTASQLRREVSNFELFLRSIGGWARAQRKTRPGILFLASSASVFGNTPGSPHTELSPPEPISNYARSKLEQEKILSAWAAKEPNVSCVIGRISNLYGPGQNIEKGQGLISQISRSVICRRPISIYVPLDTLRDYLYVDDCAKLIALCLDRLDKEIGSDCPDLPVTKILASHASSSIAEILGVFREIAKKSPQIIVAQHPRRNGQARGSALRSLIWPEVTIDHPTLLATGIAAVHRHHLKLFMRGQLRS